MKVLQRNLFLTALVQDETSPRGSFSVAGQLRPVSAADGISDRLKSPRVDVLDGGI